MSNIKNGFDFPRRSVGLYIEMRHGPLNSIDRNRNLIPEHSEVMSFLETFLTNGSFAAEFYKYLSATTSTHKRLKLSELWMRVHSCLV